MREDAHNISISEKERRPNTKFFGLDVNLPVFSISSGLAIMACNKNLYAPNPNRERTPLNFNISKYDNKGFTSQIIK